METSQVVPDKQILQEQLSLVGKLPYKLDMDKSKRLTVFQYIKVVVFKGVVYLLIYAWPVPLLFFGAWFLDPDTLAVMFILFGWGTWWLFLHASARAVARAKDLTIEKLKKEGTIFVTKNEAVSSE